MQSIEEVLEEVSVVIPIAPGSIAWRDLIIDLRQFPAGTEFLFCRNTGLNTYEQRLVDHLRKTYAVKWLITTNNFAQQCNRGAEVASKKYLWFLPSEAHFLRRTLNALGTVLRLYEHAIYYFDVVPLQASLPPIRLLQTNFQSRLRQTPSFQHGLALPKSLFHATGHFRTDIDTLAAEDFIQRARALGAEIRAANALLYNNCIPRTRDSSRFVKKALGFIKSAKALYTGAKN